MHPPIPADIQALEEALSSAEHDARALVAGLTEEQGAWRPERDSWSVAECLDHLATGNRVYLRAMRPAAERALARGRRRRGPAQPGFIGRWFVRTLEPPVKPRFRMKAPRSIRPRTSPPLRDAVGQFLASQDEVRARAVRETTVVPRTARSCGSANVQRADGQPPMKGPAR